MRLNVSQIRWVFVTLSAWGPEKLSIATAPSFELRDGRSGELLSGHSLEGAALGRQAALLCVVERATDNTGGWSVRSVGVGCDGNARDYRAIVAQCVAEIRRSQKL
jgi:hypothetical protein